jgi:hypothetical protein
VSAIRGRLDAASRNDTVAWSKFVADDMMAPLEGAVRSKQGWIRQHESSPREVTHGYGPLQDVKVRINRDTAIVTSISAAATRPNGCRRPIRHSSCPAKQRAGTPRGSSSSGTPAVASLTTSIARWARRIAS